MGTVVFDLDGVILDSEKLVTRGYRAAGAEPPAPVLTLEGSNWLARRYSPQQEAYVRHTKNAVYLAGIRRGEVPFHTGAWVAQELWREGHRVHLLTGAPVGTLAVLRPYWERVFSTLSPWPFTITIEAMPTPAKMRFIARLARTEAVRGVYVDDQTRFINLPRDWKFVRCDDRSVDTLLGHITGILNA